MLNEDDFRSLRDAWQNLEKLEQGLRNGELSDIECIVASLLATHQLLAVLENRAQRSNEHTGMAQLTDGLMPN